MSNKIKKPKIDKARDYNALNAIQRHAGAMKNDRDKRKTNKEEKLKEEIENEKATTPSTPDILPTSSDPTRDS